MNETVDDPIDPPLDREGRIVFVQEFLLATDPNDLDADFDLLRAGHDACVGDIPAGEEGPGTMSEVDLGPVGDESMAYLYEIGEAGGSGTWYVYSVFARVDDQTRVGRGCRIHVVTTEVCREDGSARSGDFVKATPSSSASTVRPLSPLRDFLRKESAGATLLCAAAVVALVWANSPWSTSYEDLWSTRLAVSLGDFTLDLDLRHWVNDGLMAVFFLVVGLEIKREVTGGHLATRRAALLPVLAAVGGMVVPALIYLAVAGGEAARGWAIPVATDIALAVGVLSVAGKRVPSALRAFLLGLAIVDDIGAIIIIAVVYSSGVTFGWMVAAVVGVIITLVVRRVGVQSVPVYMAAGVVVWLGLYKGGVHPTLAGVIMGLIAPVTPRRSHDYVDIEERPDLVDVVGEDPTEVDSRDSVSVVEWLLHVLHPWSSFVIVPIFALANSGLEVSAKGFGDALGSAITWGVFLGLVFGKPLGILLSTVLAVRAGVADRPRDVSTRHILGAGSAAGIGFTVALFITELALDEGPDRANAKLAILVASLVSATLSMVLLATRSSRVDRATAIQHSFNDA